jgi:RsiW-degrading membrane proteinase PrsW (M82 family)
MNVVFSIILAPLPSIVWLAFYLRKDKHPEPNRMVIKIFLLGVLMVPVAGIFEQLFFVGSEKMPIYNRMSLIIIGFALIEEILKYLVIRFWVLKNSDFDEPVDAMIYMIIAALGFAAAENIYLASQLNLLVSPLEFTITRFLGATFLHALASAIIGYFLAASLLIVSKIRKILVIGGILTATVLHSIFNYIIILNSQEIINGIGRDLYLLILLVGMALIVSVMFKKINKYRSICKI